MPQPNLNADELDAIEIDLAKCPRDWLALERVVVAAPSLLAQARAAEVLAEALQAFMAAADHVGPEPDLEAAFRMGNDALATYRGRSA